ncbi:hypothetical protein GLU60_02635 [Nanohaloarchaea archaeon H01]|nr:hypothetical protein [Nanohaloarchaea archaeon H01]
MKHGEAVEEARGKWEAKVHAVYRLLEEADEDYNPNKVEAVADYLIGEYQDGGLNAENQTNLAKLLKIGKDKELSGFDDLEEMKQKYLEK